MSPGISHRPTVTPRGRAEGSGIRCKSSAFRGLEFRVKEFRGLGFRVARALALCALTVVCLGLAWSSYTSCVWESFTMCVCVCVSAFVCVSASILVCALLVGLLDFSSWVLGFCGVSGC